MADALNRTTSLPDRLTILGIDIPTHNQEVKAMWAAVHAGKPYRIPIILGTNTRFFMFNQSANPGQMDFKKFSEDPDMMFDQQLHFQRWSRFNLLQDQELGLPEKWNIGPDFQNYYEAGWFGCPIDYMAGQVPDTHPVFADNPEKITEKGLPDPFGNLMARAGEYYELFKQRAARETFLDRPISVYAPCGGTDGPMTVACNLFGPEFVCSAMIEEPERIRSLLGFITDATIHRLQVWRKYTDQPAKQSNYGFADDSVAMLSAPMYREHVLPHHQKLCDSLGEPGPRSIHLCGDSTRHFVTLRDELNVNSFDTGFPVDFGKLRKELGPKINIQGGPHVEFLLNANPAQVTEEVKRILGTGVLEGGRFVLREGNNLAPYTPLENCEAMYRAGRAFGMIPPACTV